MTSLPIPSSPPPPAAITTDPRSLAAASAASHVARTAAKAAVAAASATTADGRQRLETPLAVGMAVGQSAAVAAVAATTAADTTSTSVEVSAAVDHSHPAAAGARGSNRRNTTAAAPKPATKGPPPDDVVGNYRLDRTIGQGTYGKVKLGFHLQTGEKVAVKLIEKCAIQSQKQVARLQREIRFLKLLHHPHIVRVLDVVETASHIYIAMEYAAGGELFDYIVSNKRLRDREARGFFRMILSAVDYCHKNLLLDEKKWIKIIDFGFGNNYSTDGLLDTYCG
ncbi:hypothetical protein HK405_001040, partial [Cladochytrium tenue]